MKLKQLQYASRIEEIGSINRAAQSLGVSQPCISNAIMDLEKEIGFKIFNRTSRGITATSDGAELINYINNVLAAYRLLESRYTHYEEGKHK